MKYTIELEEFNINLLLDSAYFMLDDFKEEIRKLYSQSPQTEDVKLQIKNLEEFVNTLNDYILEVKKQLKEQGMEIESIE